ncbi:hypothetical protein L6452_25905 [Arctium lappa]|uniref:Uncharacterized protein n=1 Tax=Arctium lappa TaxID=4217 RepID=A0ACB9ACK3_ARCLA|nr:hypothetical protein L6452_25905 [Arctium lappa]
MVSCMKMQNYLRKEYVAFLAHVVNKENKKKKCIQDFPIIRDFHEVFSDELPGLPPPRQVEFRIDLIPGAAPVSNVRHMKLYTDDKLKAARDRQKSYADNRRKSLEFQSGDKVLLKVSPWKGLVRFGKRGKLSPGYIGPFVMLERIGPVAYKLKLPQVLSAIQDTFHESNLKKCLTDESLVINPEEVQIVERLRFVEKLIEIVDREVKRLRRSKIPILKIHWNSRLGPEYTWEPEDHMKLKYPHLFTKDQSIDSNP